MPQYKGYLRQLLRRLRDLERAMSTNDMEEAKRILSEIIKDTVDTISDD